MELQDAPGIYERRNLRQLNAEHLYFLMLRKGTDRYLSWHRKVVTPATAALLPNIPEK